MALEYYDDAIRAKLLKWTPTDINIRILKPDETKRMFELLADDSKDKKVALPLLALSRNNDIELLLNMKTPKSYDGLKVSQNEQQTALMNVIPIKLQYQLDIYTKTQAEASEYLRQYLFKLINNPVIKIVIPYNGQEITQIANIRIFNTVSDTSDIPQHLFPGQFTRWTIQFEIQDAFLYDIPYRKNWKIYTEDDELYDPNYYSVLELATNLRDDSVEESEVIDLYFKKESQ